MNASQFKELILPTYSAMEIAARRILHDADSASDAVQDVMRRLWEMHQDIDIDINLTAYAVRAVTNRCIDIVRRRRPTTDIDTLSDVADETDDERAELLEMLNRTIATLGEPRHTIITMSLDGYSTADIAKEVGMTDANVRQILSRTRKELKNA